MFIQRGFTPILVVLLIAVSVAVLTIFEKGTVEKLIVRETGIREVVTTPLPTLPPAPTASPSATPIPTSVNTPTPFAKVQSSNSAPVSAPPSSGYAHITVSTSRGNFPINVITIDMSSARMVTDSASDSDCSADCPTMPLSDFANRNGAFAAINGTYFCPSTYDECSSKKNSTDFPVYNSRLSKWISQGTLFWNSRSIVYSDGSGLHFMQDAKSFSGGLTAGIVNYPGLLNGGNDISGAFSLSTKQTTPYTDGGVGFHGNIVHLVVANGVTMADMAAIFKALGDNYALNLDGGGSSALWYQGSYKYGPGRNLPNAVLFVH